jgi:hypothetical protein
MSSGNLQRYQRSAFCYPAPAHHGRYQGVRRQDVDGRESANILHIILDRKTNTRPAQNNGIARARISSSRSGTTTKQGHRSASRCSSISSWQTCSPGARSIRSIVRRPSRECLFLPLVGIHPEHLYFKGIRAIPRLLP